jgi:large subunit ribosomal protein L21
LNPKPTDKKTAGRLCGQLTAGLNSERQKMFAVIKTGGKQYRVAANDLLKVEKLAGNVGDTVEFGQVLVFGEGESATIGAPFVDGAMVTAEVVEQGKSRTVVAFKKRRRQNSRRKIGHRQLLTTVKITEILTGGAKPAKKAKAEPKAEVAEAAAEADKPVKKAKAEPKAEEAAEKPAKKAAPKKAASAKESE